MPRVDRQLTTPPASKCLGCLALLLAIVSLPGCGPPEGEKNCKAIQLGTDVSTLPRLYPRPRAPDGGSYSSSQSPPPWATLLGIGHELQCCWSCGYVARCQCDYWALGSIDCTDPLFHGVDYVTLGGDFYGACEKNPDGAYNCMVAERDGKVVAVFGTCYH